MEKREIEITRNVIERALMAVKDYINTHMKEFVIGCVSALGLAVLITGGIIVHNAHENASLVKFEQVLDAYNSGASGDPQARIANCKKTAGDLEGIVQKSWWGYVHENGYFVIGGLYYSERLYAEAKDYYLKFAEKSPRSFFAPMALQQAARSYESLGDFAGALQTYVRLEKKYGKSVIADQIYYDLGRIYQRQGDIFKARENYNRVVTAFPQSRFARMARERLFLLGLHNG